MSYLKMPPYGRKLLDQRELGHHPAKVYVLYAARWFDRPRGVPCLCVGSDYTHGIYDWSVVAGLPVDLLWQNGRRIRRLIAELAEYSPLLHIITPRGRMISPTEFFYTRPGRRRHPMWSVEAEERYHECQDDYYRALLEQLNSETQHG